jgi:hypothetical protein
MDIPPGLSGRVGKISPPASNKHRYYTKYALSTMDTQFKYTAATASEAVNINAHCTAF